MKYNRRRIILLTIFTLISLLILYYLDSFSTKQTENNIVQYANNGILDLSKWDTTSQPIYPLEGEWSFYFQQLLNPNTDNSIKPSGNIHVPDKWNNFSYNKNNIGSYGYATYRLHVILPKDCSKLALKIPDMSSSYQLFINGEKICSNGKVGTSNETEKPYWKPIVTTLNTTEKELDIIVYVSNFHHIRGGMWESILIGTEQAIYKNRELHLLRSLFFIGVLVILGLYHLDMFLLIQKNYSSLYLGLFCFATALREFLVREVVATILFPKISFYLISKLEYITIPSGPIFLSLLIHSLYPKEFSKKILKGIIFVFSLYILIIIFTPLKIYSMLLPTYQFLFISSFIYMLYVIIIAKTNHRPGSTILLLGTITLLITATADTAYIFKFHNNYKFAHMFTIGFFIFIVCQMHTISIIIANHYKKSQNFAKAELAFLQAQIVPHFLYNTLNTIIYLTKQSPEKACNLLLELSNYLRAKFNFKIYNQKHLVYFDYEFGIVQSYLTIEKARFEDKLEIIYDIDPQVLHFKIPPFTLQPLVENAVRHGLKSKVPPCTIKISAKLNSKYLIMIVEDNGIGISKEKISLIMNGTLKNQGIGLYNIHKRLFSIYGQGIKIDSTVSIGTKIAIQIPTAKETLYAKSYAN